MLIKIDELVTKYCINYTKEGFRSEMERGAVVTCSGDGSLSDKKALYELDMSHGRNKCPRMVFLMSGEIPGCSIDSCFRLYCELGG